MKIKLDENLPERLVAELQALGHDVDTVRSEGLAGCEDAEVWLGAQAADRFLITQDLDFADARKFQPGTHAGLLLVRLAHPGRRRWPCGSRPYLRLRRRTDGEAVWSWQPNTR